MFFFTKMPLSHKKIFNHKKKKFQKDNKTRKTWKTYIKELNKLEKIRKPRYVKKTLNSRKN